MMGEDVRMGRSMVSALRQCIRRAFAFPHLPSTAVVLISGFHMLVLWILFGIWNVRWADPLLWLVGYFGLMTILRAGFFEIWGWYSFAAWLGMLSFLGSIGYGLVSGFGESISWTGWFLALTLGAVVWGKRQFRKRRQNISQ